MSMRCTILIPTKDRPALLRRAILSALEVAPADAEILIIDDKSDLPAKTVVAEFDDQRLKTLVNSGPNGAAAARNFGMQAATGAVVFFLDDDDEFLADYCDTILDVVLPTHPNIAYGFSAYRITGKKPDNMADDTIGNNKLPDGVIAQTAPFRRKLCGFGMGFWIRRDVFNELGPIDETMVTNEDTEYSCRLIDAGKVAWFSAQPGVRLHTHITDTSNALGHLTTRTSSADRAQCFLTIYKRYEQLTKTDHHARRHLAHRYIKLSTKSGRFAESWSFAATMPELSERVLARYYTVVNYAAYRLVGK